VGDGKVWDRRGGVGTELRLAGQDAVTPTGTSGPADELTERLYDALSTVPGATLELDVMVNGHQADAVLTRHGHRRAVLIDRGPVTDVDPAAHLQRMLCRRELLGERSIRLPTWMLFDEPAAVQRWIEGS
jgi:hypothetical protein